MRGVTTTIAVLVVGCAVGGAAGSMLASKSATTDAFRRQDVDFAEVVASTYDGRRDAQLSISLDDGPTLTVASSGLVTSSSCSPDDELASGEPLLAVNGAPVVAFATGIPMWRDLSLGARGTDVAAVQAELRRLGFVLEETGEFDKATLQAVNALGKFVGWAKLNGLPMSALIWMPAPTLDLAECPLSIGAAVGPGTVVAVLPPTVTQVQLLASATPDALPASAWQFTSDIGTLRLDANGEIGVDAVEQISSSLDAPVDGKVVVDGHLELASAINVVAVAPGSVWISADDPLSGCITDSKGATHTVKIIDSELGRTLVTFDGDPPIDVLVRNEGCASG